MALCISSCSLASSNTGIPTGAKSFGVPVAILVVPLKNASGVANVIDLALDTLDQTYVDNKINAVADQRWFPIIGLENVTSEKAENIVESFNSGNLQIISEGVRSVTGMLPSKPHEYLKQLKNFSCQKIGVYLIDGCGNFMGSVRVAGELAPLRISQNTWSNILMWATDTTGQNITLSFNFDKKEKDEEMAMIYASSITADLDLIEGLIDVVLTTPVAVAATKKVTFIANTLYGDASLPIRYEALLLGDFTCTSNAVANVVASMVETDGAYELTLTSTVTIGHIVTVAVNKDGISVDTISTVAI